MSKLKSGEIYEVLLREADGNFSKHTQDNDENDRKTYLIHVIIEQAMVNDVLENILFFRDVTFCILHEQIKAKEKLSNIINDTLNQKIGVPLSTLIKTCENIL